MSLLNGLDFLTVAGNFLDAYANTSLRYKDRAHNEAREDAAIAENRGYLDKVRGEDRSFQEGVEGRRRDHELGIMLKDQDFRKALADQEWVRGAESRALELDRLRAQLNMTNAEFEEWKATAEGRKKLAELEIQEKQASIRERNANTSFSEKRLQSLNESDPKFDKNSEEIRRQDMIFKSMAAQPKWNEEMGITFEDYNDIIFDIASKRADEILAKEKGIQEQQPAKNYNQLDKVIPGEQLPPEEMIKLENLIDEVSGAEARKAMKGKRYPEDILLGGSAVTPVAAPFLMGTRSAVRGLRESSEKKKVRKEIVGKSMYHGGRPNPEYPTDKESLIKVLMRAAEPDTTKK